ncbi:response regulator [Methylobacterium sp. Leaf117]|uniref:response regulator n=1 Tax=Methylobacterium sp. Leaf117 TaxID=1736260 RepID=UPI0006F793EC|nr:response regulator [Methylobacterium sp. Leaf117]KQP88134.1 response regulator [Methylobacterium sp. Leaf117]
MSEPLRVLIAEDEALILMQLEFLVEDAGHIVVGTAATSDEAIRVARETRPDLVFVDLQLRGGSSGIDIVRALRNEDAIVLIFVTANAQHIPDHFEGAAGAIPKPFTEAAIFDTIAYFSECVRSPPPRAPQPLGLSLAPAYLASLGGA